MAGCTVSPRANDVKSTAGCIENVRAITTNTGGTKRKRNYNQPGICKRVRFDVINGDGGGDDWVFCNVDTVTKSASLVEPNISVIRKNSESGDVESAYEGKRSRVPENIETCDEEISVLGRELRDLSLLEQLRTQLKRPVNAQIAMAAF